jgi:hypothetical protein
MRKTFQKSSPMLALVLAGMFTAAPVYADKPDWAGNGKHSKQESRNDYRGDDENRHSEKKGKHHQRDDDHGRRGDDRDSRDGSRISINAYFDDRERDYARGYYREEFSRGHCPPRDSPKRTMVACHLVRRKNGTEARLYQAMWCTTPCPTR